MEWIKTSDRLPELDDLANIYSKPVLIVTKDLEVQPYTYCICRYEYSRGRTEEYWETAESSSEYGAEYGLDEVIAWMPLPSYRKDEELWQDED